MNWYNLVFYHIFKRYYNDGKYKNDIPWLTALVIISVSSSFYILSGLILIYYFFVNKNIPIINKYPIILLGFTFAVINYLWFANNKRYLNIYKHYNTNTANRRSEIFSWVFVILGFASVPFVALLIRH
jgi:hypothetical protein